MSNHQAKTKESLVEGSTAEKGLGNAAMVVRSTSWSGVSFSQMTNVSGSKVMTKKTAKPMNGQETDVDAERMENGSNKQSLDASSSSYVYPSMASRATGTLPLLFTNSSRKVKSPPEVQVQLSEAEMKQWREVNRIRDKQNELADHQHNYVQCRKESSKWRADELQQFKDEWKKENSLF